MTVIPLDEDLQVVGVLDGTARSAAQRFVTAGAGVFHSSRTKAPIETLWDVTDRKLERLSRRFGPLTSTGRVREVVVHFSVDRGISERSSGRVQDRPTPRVGHGPYCEW